VHDPLLLQVFVQVEGVGQSSSEQITAPVQVMWQPFPGQVVLQLPVLWQSTLHPPPAHEKRQLPAALQLKEQPPPGQSYSQLPTTLQVQLVPAGHVAVRFPTVGALPQATAPAPIPSRHASSNPFALPDPMTSSLEFRQRRHQKNPPPPSRKTTTRTIRMVSMDTVGLQGFLDRGDLHQPCSAAPPVRRRNSARG
jgi:hypothetical protein